MKAVYFIKSLRSVFLNTLTSEGRLLLQESEAFFTTYYPNNEGRAAVEDLLRRRVGIGSHADRAQSALVGPRGSAQGPVDVVGVVVATTPHVRDAVGHGRVHPAVVVSLQFEHFVVGVLRVGLELAVAAGGRGPRTFDDRFGVKNVLGWERGRV